MTTHDNKQKVLIIGNPSLNVDMMKAIEDAQSKGIECVYTLKSQEDYLEEMRVEAEMQIAKEKQFQDKLKESFALIPDLKASDYPYIYNKSGRGAYQRNGYRNLPAGLSKRKKLANKRQKIARRKNRK